MANDGKCSIAIFDYRSEIRLTMKNEEFTNQSQKSTNFAWRSPCSFRVKVEAAEFVEKESTEYMFIQETSPHALQNGTLWQPKWMPTTKYKTIINKKYQIWLSTKWIQKSSPSTRRQRPKQVRCKPPVCPRSIPVYRTTSFSTGVGIYNPNTLVDLANGDVKS